MGQTREQKIIKSLSGKPSVQLQTPIATDMFLPNHSGDHSAGLVIKSPTKDLDIVNKLYVDGEIVDKSWIKSVNQTGLTGNKTGSFDLTTSGRIYGNEILVQGNSAVFGLGDRQAPFQNIYMYNSGNTFRIYNGSDILTLDSNGNLDITGVFKANTIYAHSGNTIVIGDGNDSVGINATPIHPATLMIKGKDNLPSGQDYVQQQFRSYNGALGQFATYGQAGTNGLFLINAYSTTGARGQISMCAGDLDGDYNIVLDSNGLISMGNNVNYVAGNGKVKLSVSGKTGDENDGVADPSGYGYAIRTGDGGNAYDDGDSTFDGGNGGDYVINLGDGGTGIYGGANGLRGNFYLTDGQGNILYTFQGETGNCTTFGTSQFTKGLTSEIKTDTSSPTDLTITTGANKTLVLATPVYDDLQFPTGAGKVPASNAPTWETLTTNTRTYSFAVNDYIDLQCSELPHWWKEGTNGDAHLHLTLKTANSTGSNRYAKFTIWVAYVDTNETWVEQSPITAELTIPTGSAALKALYLDMGDVILTNYLIGGQVKIRVKRIAATGGTEYASNIFITQCGVHLQKDTMGSRSEYTK